MSNPSHLISATFNPPNLRRKSIRRRAYVGTVFFRTRQTAKALHRAAKDYPVRSRYRSVLLNR
jgi:hypothetical protein